MYKDMNKAIENPSLHYTKLTHQRSFKKKNLNLKVEHHIASGPSTEPNI